MNTRDDFSKETIRSLGARAGLICSNPECRVFTKGAHSKADRAASIGKACHIHAAAPQGPRYDPMQTEEQRRAVENGIWLCSNCSTLVDNDEKRFPPSMLRQWKDDAEADSKIRIGTRGAELHEVGSLLTSIPTGAEARLSYVPFDRRPTGTPHTTRIRWQGVDVAGNVVRFTCTMGDYDETSYAVPIGDVEDVWCPDGTWVVRVSGYLDRVPFKPYRYVSQGARPAL